MEVMIAVTIFAIVSVGLAMALHSTIESSNYLDKQTLIRYGLESMLNEAQRKPKRQQMAFTQKDERYGIEYRTELRALRFVNMAGESIDGMWALVATAEYTENGEPRKESVELYVHRP